MSVVIVVGGGAGDGGGKYSGINGDAKKKDK